MEIEQGEIVLCTVDRIVGTNVFVKIHLPGKGLEGTLTMSEIAPGRIRNLRDYVVPKKKIVCKVLRVNPNGNINLSLRRVTKKERKELIEEVKQEKSYKSILKSVLKEKAEEVIKKITSENSLYNFMQESKSNPKILEKIVSKKDAEKILEILSQQKQKISVSKKEIFLSTDSPDGLEKIKELEKLIPDVKMKYLSSGKYSIKSESEDAKEAGNKIKEETIKIEEYSKKHKINFQIKEK